MGLACKEAVSQSRETILIFPRAFAACTTLSEPSIRRPSLTGGSGAELDLIILTLFGVILIGLFRGNEVRNLVGYFLVELSAISAHPLRKLGSLVKISNHRHTNSPESLARLWGLHFLGGRASHGVLLQRVLEIVTQKSIDKEVGQGVVRGSR